jgi:iron complex transport system ATP-binding protein
LADVEYTRLSGGQRQLVLIARAIAQDAHAIIMDEPTASLDFGNQVIVLSEVRRLAAQNVAIVLSTHDPAQALSIADSVALVHQGRLVAKGNPTATLLPDRLREIYGVEVTIERLSHGQIACVPNYR